MLIVAAVAATFAIASLLFTFAWQVRADEREAAAARRVRELEGLLTAYTAQALRVEAPEPAVVNAVPRVTSAIDVRRSIDPAARKELARVDDDEHRAEYLATLEDAIATTPDLDQAEFIRSLLR